MAGDRHRVGAAHLGGSLCVKLVIVRRGGISCRLRSHRLVEIPQRDQREGESLVSGEIRELDEWERAERYRAGDAHARRGKHVASADLKPPYSAAPECSL